MKRRLVAYLFLASLLAMLCGNAHAQPVLVQHQENTTGTNPTAPYTCATLTTAPTVGNFIGIIALSGNHSSGWYTPAGFTSVGAFCNSGAVQAAAFYRT